MKGLQMTLKDIANAVSFLRRMSVGQADSERLIRTVEALEKFIQQAKEENNEQRDNG